VPSLYRALVDYSNIPRSTLYYRARGRRSIEEKAQGQQNLTLWEEDIIIKLLLQISDIRQLIRIKFILSIAFITTRKRPIVDRLLKPLSRVQVF
jgi:hypothetical protein